MTTTNSITAQYNDVSNDKMIIKIKEYTIKPALVVIDVQNGFVSKGGSYDKSGIDISQYQKVIPTIKRLINECKSVGIPIFFTEAVRELSGIDLLTKTHRILPRAREERIKGIPICVKGTWDADIIQDLKFDQAPIIIKRRDSAFQDTCLDEKLRSLGINTIIFCGVDASMCVESSLRDAFNIGYDVIIISDTTASMNPKRYECTLDDVKSFYGLVISSEELVNGIAARKK